MNKFSDVLKGECKDQIGEVVSVVKTDSYEIVLVKLKDNVFESFDVADLEVVN